MGDVNVPMYLDPNGRLLHDEEDYRLLHVLYRGEFSRRFAPMSSNVDGKPLVDMLENVVMRARRCLHGRTDTQVGYIAEFSDWLASAAILAGRVVGLCPDGTEKRITVEDAEHVEGRELVQLAANVIQSTIDHADDGTFSIGFLDENGNRLDEIEVLTRTDVYAAHALVQYVRATEFDGEGWLACAGAMHGMIATECVTLAEVARISDSRSSRDEFKVKLGNMNSHAAQTRWRKLDPLKELAHRLYGERSWSSRAMAVRTIAPAVLAEAQKRNLYLSAMNAEATITGWLKKHLKR